MSKPEKNQFFDISRFPKDWGLVVLPISMTRIANAFKPQKCMDYLALLTEKIQENKVGAQFIYSEGLYMNFEKDAYLTKNNFAQTCVSHMLGIRKLVAKDIKKYQIDSAFSFESWFQMYLSHKDFFKVYRTVKELYDNDLEFQKYVAEDAASQGKELTDRQVAFFLEEHVFSYLLLAGEMQMRNDFVNGRERWILLAYPGKPPKSQIYLISKNPLNLDLKSNPYIGQYDLVAERFIDYRNVDLETFNY